MNKVSIIIPCWNSEKHFKKNLPFVIKAVKHKRNNISEIIVVDDASPDGSVSYLQKYYPQVRIIKNNKNKGFSATINAGVKASKGDLIVLLNADVCPSENFLFPTLRHFKDKKIFGVSFSEKGYSWATASLTNGFFNHKPGKRTNQPHDTMWISGGSGIFKKSIWRELKGFDETLFSPFYWEDVDISYRALKRGYKILWEPKAKVVHNHESVINTNYFNKTKLSLTKERNELIFHWKNITNPILFQKHIYGLLSRLYHHPGYIKVILYTLLRVIPVIKARKKEIQEEKVSDIVILSKFDRD